jgi:4-diphosphocytidyl-2-C-methyl-D-erythritol kinase
MICFPNGKINIGLNILEKRLDGFHNIESLIYPVDLHDVLEFLPSQQFSLTIYGQHVRSDQENLVTKAWELMRLEYSIPPVAVKLFKSIPGGSGLGGGSSDASSFFKALNEFFNLKIPIKRMVEHALEIGSDCPFFIQNKPSLVTGRGDVLNTSTVSLKGYYMVIVLPRFSISTGKAFSMIRPGKPDIPLSEIIKQPISTWKEMLKNDFEIPVFKIYPELREIKKLLYRAGASFASMSGTGSAVYGIFEEKPQPVDLHSKYRVWQGFITQ